MKEIPNLSYIDTLSKGNTAFAKTLLGIIKKELLGEIETYQSHLRNKDFTKSAEDVHKLHHKIKILGLVEGSEIADEYRSDLLKNNLKLRSDFESILNSISLFIKKI